MISFFFSCKYYPYPIAAFLSYFVFSWIVRKIVSLYEEGEQLSVLEQLSSGENKIDHELIRTRLEMADVLLHSRQIQLHQMPENQSEVSSLQTQPHQLQEFPPDVSPLQIQPSYITECAPSSCQVKSYKVTECPRKPFSCPFHKYKTSEAPLSTDVNSMTKPPLDSKNLAHLLQPLQYSTEPFEDIPELNSNVLPVSGNSKSTSRRKRQKLKDEVLRKPKQRKKKPAIQSE
ncbi:uncharacterized protein LOC129964030 [Argiope bruennichi]|uniref:uncharacterized protein LOC129964030 n=1 Tax=Argiope bruennichi TaxID=94029 RepID=UPI002494DD71|nr:uncharacterized protein LOC129964030 [Argiope bruennichi]